jgi:hypothetical protein
MRALIENAKASVLTVRCVLYVFICIYARATILVWLDRLPGIKIRFTAHPAALPKVSPEQNFAPTKDEGSLLVK